MTTSVDPGYCKTRVPMKWGPPGSSVTLFEGVLRQGHRIVWRCGHLDGDLMHDRTYHARRCAEVELKRRRDTREG